MLYSRGVVQSSSLHAGADSKGQGDTLEKSSLALAVAYSNDTTLVELLVGCGANVHMRVDNSTLLNLAIRCGGVSMVEKLINVGADVNAAGGDGITPLMLAVDYGEQSEELINLLIVLGK